MPPGAYDVSECGKLRANDILEEGGIARAEEAQLLREMRGRGPRLCLTNGYRKMRDGLQLIDRKIITHTSRVQGRQLPHDAVEAIVADAAIGGPAVVSGAAAGAEDADGTAAGEGGLEGLGAGRGFAGAVRVLVLVTVRTGVEEAVALVAVEPLVCALGRLHDRVRAQRRVARDARNTGPVRAVRQRHDLQRVPGRWGRSVSLPVLPESHISVL